MPGFTPMLVVTAMATCCAAPVVGQSSAREATDVYIRRLAGLPPESARGEIEIIDVGHDPMSTMLSIVGNRTDKGWMVSYACAASPHCARGVDHIARTYALSPAASAEVDGIVDQLRKGGEPDGQLSSPASVGGWLAVDIDYQGFRREYRRTILWGKTLGKLEALMDAPANDAK